jgi:hypothetical protein
MIMNERRPRAAAVDEDFSLSSLRLFRCSDCRADELFERPPSGEALAAYSEWACTACGAAYFDGIDVVIELSAQTRGVA